MTAVLNITRSEKCVDVSICGELTIYSAAQLKDELLVLLKTSPILMVNLAEVDDIDTAGLQILIMLKKEAKNLGYEVSFTDHSSPVINVIELLNMVNFFGDPLVLTH